MTGILCPTCRRSRSAFQRTIVLHLLILFFAAILFCAKPAYADTCSHLNTLKLADTKIVSAETVPAGTLTFPSEVPSSIAKALPAFCRVIAELHPTKDSDIKMEVWMPASGWNGKFMGTGNGAFAGSIRYSDMAQEIQSGYASAGTDTGHAGGGAAWAIGHPEKLIDFGYRAVHEMTVKAKSIVSAYYARPPHYSYFDSCSNGGRQGLTEAQRFPEDYNGIIAGDPAIGWTHAAAKLVLDMQALYANPASRIPPSKLPLIHSAYLHACDAQDGVKDGMVTDPRTCHFDPEVLACKAGNSDACLTGPQIEALKNVYSDVKDSHGNSIFSGYFPGGELGPDGWALWLDAPSIGQNYQYIVGRNFFADLVYGDPTWDYRTFQVDRDVKAADVKLSRILNATDPHLDAFANQGGKLILYEGWTDAGVTPLSTIDYYKSVVAAMPTKNNSFMRLYMVPGMQHCGAGMVAAMEPHGGLGAVQFDMLSSLERWVESGTTPSSIVATYYASPTDKSTKITMTRPLCPHPQESRYKGAGDTRNATSFECK